MLGAIGLAISTTIGAGVLGLPKAFFLVGPAGIAIGLVVALFLLISAYMLADLLKRESKPVQIPALIADYLGQKWKYFVYLTLIFSMYGALSAYLIGFGDQLEVLIGLAPLMGGLFLFLFGAFVVFKGTRLIEDINLPISALMVAFLVGVALLNLLNFRGFEFSAPTVKAGMQFAGTMLFALFGLNILPEINYLTKGRAKLAYTLSTLVCFFLYLLFAVTTVGVLGSETTGLGTAGLASFYGGAYNLAISIFTLFALLTSFLGIGLGMRHIYEYDFRLPRLGATLAVVLPPLAIFLSAGYTGVSFLGILGLAGELTLPLFTLTISYAYYRASDLIETSIPYPRLVSALVGLFYLSFFGFSLFNLIF